MDKRLAFQFFQVAQEQYGLAADALNAEQHRDVQRIAERKVHIEDAVLASAEAAQVVVPSEVVEKSLSEITGRYDHPTEFQQDIARIGIDDSAFQQSLARELRVQSVLDLVSGDNETISDTEVSLFYYMNTAKFSQPEIRTARHILVTINDTTLENCRENASRKIQQIAARLKKKPERFEEQALKHSECPTSLQGGLLGKVKKGVLYPELEAVLFKLELGQLSELVESPLGFHILRCDEIQEPGVMPLQDIEPRLKDYLQNRRRKQKQRQWLENLLQARDQTRLRGETVNG